MSRLSLPLLIVFLLVGLLLGGCEAMKGANPAVDYTTGPQLDPVTAELDRQHRETRNAMHTEVERNRDRYGTIYWEQRLAEEQAANPYRVPDEGP